MKKVLAISPGFLHNKNMSNTLKIGKTEYAVEFAGEKEGFGKYYILTGKRGACYLTIRNVHSGRMTVINPSGATPRPFARVRLTDVNGPLEVA